MTIVGSNMCSHTTGWLVCSDTASMRVPATTASQRHELDTIQALQTSINGCSHPTNSSHDGMCYMIPWPWPVAAESVAHDLEGSLLCTGAWQQHHGPTTYMDQHVDLRHKSCACDAEACVRFAAGHDRHVTELNTRWPLSVVTRSPGRWDCAPCCLKQPATFDVPWHCRVKASRGRRSLRWTCVACASPRPHVFLLCCSRC